MTEKNNQEVDLVRKFFKTLMEVYEYPRNRCIDCDGKPTGKRMKYDDPCVEAKYYCPKCGSVWDYRRSIIGIFRNTCDPLSAVERLVMQASKRKGKRRGKRKGR